MTALPEWAVPGNFVVALCSRNSLRKGTVYTLAGLVPGDPRTPPRAILAEMPGDLFPLSWFEPTPWRYHLLFRLMAAGKHQVEMMDEIVIKGRVS